MDVDAVWRHTHEQRRALAALLHELSEDEWALPSLCEGWTVRDVAAHVMRSATVTPFDMAVALVRSRGRYNALVADDARRAARRPVAELVVSFLFADSALRRHLEIRATDADFAVGKGALVEGPTRAVLLLLTGRTAAALPGLSGPGVERLT